ncbi:MAG: coenzyme F420-0:L-glutamate ligase [Thaumarchaeota archaeon]|nr:coenzyme F420-0:L-glutamate ligase [Nitrososphaerota archaeon]
MSELRIISAAGIPEIKTGDDLGDIIIRACRKQGLDLRSGDVVVVKSKIVSKAEGRVVKIDDVVPSTLAKNVSQLLKKDSKSVEIVFSESKRIVRMVRGLCIAETRHGFVCANAGVDQSNFPAGYAGLLPLDPDASARRIRDKIQQKLGVDTAVIITDTFGRPWREGQVDVAIGVSGIKATRDYRGLKDPYGYELRVTEIAVADEIASAADLVMEKTRRTPVAVVRGYSYQKADGSARDLIRRPSRDLFR